MHDHSTILPHHKFQGDFNISVAVKFIPDSYGLEMYVKSKVIVTTAVSLDGGDCWPTQISAAKDF